MQPQTATNDLVEQLQRLRNMGRYTELELRRIERQAESIKQQEPVEGYMLLGMVGCLKQDIESVHKNHQASLRAHGENSILLRNYATSIGSLGFRSEAVELERRAYVASSKEDTDIQEYASSIYVNARFNDLYQFMVDTNIDYLEKEQLRIGKLKSIIDSAKTRGVTDDDCELAINAVNRVMHEHGYYLNHLSPVLFGAGDSAWFSYQILPLLMESSDSVYELNNALIEEQVSNSYLAFETSLIVARFSLMSAKEGAA